DKSSPSRESGRRQLPMKILHLGKFYPPVSGGMERVLELLCRTESTHIEPCALVANTSRRTIHEVCNGVPVTRVARVGRIGPVSLCPTFPFWLRQQSADVTVLHEPNPIALLSTMLVGAPGRLVVWFHCDVQK